MYSWNGLGNDFWNGLRDRFGNDAFAHLSSWQPISTLKRAQDRGHLFNYCFLRLVAPDAETAGSRRSFTR